MQHTVASRTPFLVWDKSKSAVDFSSEMRSFSYDKQTSVAEVCMDWILDPDSCCLEQNQECDFFAVAGAGLNLDFVFAE